MLDFKESSLFKRIDIILNKDFYKGSTIDLIINPIPMDYNVPPNDIILDINNKNSMKSYQMQILNASIHNSIWYIHRCPICDHTIKFTYNEVEEFKEKYNITRSNKNEMIHNIFCKDLIDPKHIHKG